MHWERKEEKINRWNTSAFVLELHSCGVDQLITQRLFCSSSRLHTHGQRVNIFYNCSSRFISFCTDSSVFAFDLIFFCIQMPLISCTHLFLYHACNDLFGFLLCVNVRHRDMRKKTVDENEYFALWYGRDHIELLCYLLFLVHIFWLVCFSFVTTTSTAIWINNNIYNIRNYCPLRCCNKERHNMILNIAICWFVSRYKFYSL